MVTPLRMACPQPPMLSARRGPQHRTEPRYSEDRTPSGRHFRHQHWHRRRAHQTDYCTCGERDAQSHDAGRGRSQAAAGQQTQRDAEKPGSLKPPQGTSGIFFTGQPHRQLSPDTLEQSGAHSLQTPSENHDQ
jgi:hypothetical protein